MGRDLVMQRFILAIVSFQSTRPSGARPSRGYLMIWRMISFNPRARVGRDILRSGKSCLMPSFNPRARVGRD